MAVSAWLNEGFCRNVVIGRLWLAWDAIARLKPSDHRDGRTLSRDRANYLTTVHRLPIRPVQTRSGAVYGGTNMMVVTSRGFFDHSFLVLYSYFPDEPALPKGFSILDLGRNAVILDAYARDWYAPSLQPDELDEVLEWSSDRDASEGDDGFINTIRRGIYSDPHDRSLVCDINYARHTCRRADVVVVAPDFRSNFVGARLSIHIVGRSGKDVGRSGRDVGRSGRDVGRANRASSPGTLRPGGTMTPSSPLPSKQTAAAAAGQRPEFRERSIKPPPPLPKGEPLMPARGRKARP